MEEVDEVCKICGASHKTGACESIREHPDMFDNVDIEKRLEDKDIQEILNSAERWQYPILIGAALEYLEIFKYGGSLSEFLQACLESREPDLNHIRNNASILSHIHGQLIKELHLDSKTEEIQKREIYNYLQDNLWQKGYYFSGTNGAFTERIKEQGFVYGVKHSNAEREKIYETIKKDRRNNGHELGFIQKDAGKIYVASTARDSWMYAMSSPEWFNIFT